MPLIGHLTLKLWLLDIVLLFMFVYQIKDFSPCEVIQSPQAPCKAGFLPFLSFSLRTLQFYFFEMWTLGCTIPVMVCLLLCVVASNIPVLARAATQCFCLSKSTQKLAKIQLLRHKILLTPKMLVGWLTLSPLVVSQLSARQCGSTPHMDNRCPPSYSLQPCLIRNVSSVTTPRIRVLRAAGVPPEQAGQGLPDRTSPLPPARDQGRLGSTGTGIWPG